MDATVTRNFYFKDPSGGSFRYTQEAPRKPHVHEGGCGCTTSVRVRPEGEPTQIQQGIEIQIDEDWFFNLEANWLVWKQYAAAPHAYFRVEENSIHMEITRPGYGLADCFFANIHQGASLNVSRLYNGNPPDPKVIDLSKFGPKTLWLFEGSWNGQAMRVLSEGGNPIEKMPSIEALDLETALMLGYELRRYREPFIEDYEMNVYDLRQKVLDHVMIPSYVRDMKRCFEKYVTRLHLTEVFRLSREISRAIHPKHPDSYPSI